MKIPAPFFILGGAVTLSVVASLVYPSPADPVIHPRLPDSALQQILQGIYDADQHLALSDYPVAAVVVPHHLTASESIASGIKMLTRQKRRTIVVLSPDHFFRCPTLLCTTRGIFETPLGNMMVNPRAEGELARSSLVTELPELFEQEHGIGAVIPAIKHYLPDAEIVPVVLSQNIPWYPEREQLKRLFSRFVNQDRTIVVSSDFSHYLTLGQADRTDAETATTLFAGDLEGIGTLKNPDQSDCPGCLWILTALAKEQGFFNPSVVLHTNAARILNDPTVKETTSHFSLAYYKNFALTPDDPAFAGDVTITRNAILPSMAPEMSTFWRGKGPRIVNLEGPLLPESECVRTGNMYIFCNSFEMWKRMPELATHWSVRNNHMFDQWQRGYDRTVQLLNENHEIPITNIPAKTAGLHVYALTQVMNPVKAVPPAFLEREYNTTIANLKKDSDPTALKVVFLHGGTEYGSLLTDAQRVRLQSYIDAGADAVIQAHAHIPTDMEIYKGKPIFHGIGNFLFDQFDAVPTSTAKAVRLRKVGTSIEFETQTSRITP